MIAQLEQAIRQMVRVTEAELAGFLSQACPCAFPRRGELSQAGEVPQEIFFICSGLVRVMITDREGTEHTVHFALENQFIADYAGFIQQRPAHYRLEAVEPVQALSLPRAAIEWGYRHMAEGEKLGRLIAEYYFIYQDRRIKNTYALSPKARYDLIGEEFPGIHQRVPQHMIASYLGISPVHLSRLKRAALA